MCKPTVFPLFRIPVLFSLPQCENYHFQGFFKKKGAGTGFPVFPALLFRYGSCVPVQEKVADQRASSWIFWTAISARQAIWISQKLPPPSFTVT